MIEGVQESSKLVLHEPIAGCPTTIVFNSFSSILSSVKQIASPGWMHETSAQGWCTGKTRRMGGGGRWQGGLGWGIQVNPGLIHVNVWQKPLGEKNKN